MLTGGNAVEDAAEKQQAEVRWKFARQALQQQCKDYHSKSYQVLLQELAKGSQGDGSPGERDAHALRRWYNALARCCSEIQTHQGASPLSRTASNSSSSRSRRNPHAALISTILSFDFRVPEATVRAFCGLVTSLIEVSQSFSLPALRLLVSTFLFEPMKDVTEMKSSVSNMGTSGEASVDLNQLRSCVHDTILKIIKVAPMVTTELLPLLREFYPHKLHQSVIQQRYLQNLLYISEYAGSLRNSILALIIENFILLDAEVVIGHSDEPPRYRKVKKSKVSVSTGVSELEGDDESSEASSRSMSDDESATGESFTQPGGEFAEKLDTLLCMLFSYLVLIKQQNNDMKNNFMHDVFRALLHVFDASILPTHRLRFTQYVLFLYCSFNHQYAERFINFAMEKTFDNNLPLLIRENAASYLCSFVARAKYVRSASAALAIQLGCKYLVAHIEYLNGLDESFGENGLESTERHRLFYGLFQGVLHAFSRRLDVFTTQKEINNLQLPAIIMSRLKPLSFCADYILEEFRKISLTIFRSDFAGYTQATSSGAVPALGEAASSSSISPDVVHSQVASRVQRKWEEQLKTGCFPFDPLMLNTSSSFIRPMYTSLHDLDTANLALRHEGNIRSGSQPGQLGQSSPLSHPDALPMQSPSFSYTPILQPQTTPLLTPLLSPMLGGTSANTMPPSFSLGGNSKQQSLY